MAQNQETTVLIVEDSPAEVKLLKEILNGRHTVQTANSIKEARQYKDPTVILLDLGLPDVDKQETVAEIMNLFPRAKIIVLTGCEDTTIRYDAERLGVFDYLIKFPRVERLLAVIERAIESRDRSMKLYNATARINHAFANGRAQN